MTPSLPVPSHQNRYGSPPKPTRVLFVGDKPTAMNRDPNVAFEGTASGRVLDEWIKALGLKYGEYELINRTHKDFAQTVGMYVIDSHINCKVVALGEEASKALNRLETPHFKLPPPSGLNRILNDHDYVLAILKECKYYIKGVNSFGR